MKNMIVYVEKKVLEDPAISGDESFAAITKKFCTFREGTVWSSVPVVSDPACLSLFQEI